MTGTRESTVIKTVDEGYCGKYVTWICGEIFPEVEGIIFGKNARNGKWMAIWACILSYRWLACPYQMPSWWGASYETVSKL